MSSMAVQGGVSGVKLWKHTHFLHEVGRKCLDLRRGRSTLEVELAMDPPVLKKDRRDGEIALA
jgi:hypothetical protein